MVLALGCVVVLEAIRRRRELLSQILHVLGTRCLDAPTEPFSEQAADAEELDYSCDAAWCALPGLASESDFVPEGELPVPDDDRKVPTRSRARTHAHTNASAHTCMRTQTHSRAHAHTHTHARTQPFP